jgi:hypothetical protein
MHQCKEVLYVVPKKWYRLQTLEPKVACQIDKVTCAKYNKKKNNTKLAD